MGTTFINPLWLFYWESRTVEGIYVFPTIGEVLQQNERLLIAVNVWNLHCLTNQVWMTYVEVRQIIFEIQASLNDMCRSLLMSHSQASSTTSISFTNPCHGKECLDVRLLSDTSSGLKIVMTIQTRYDNVQHSKLGYIQLSPEALAQ
ncbi:hypothetical protein ACFX14_025436 [Malus domestica]